MRRFAIVIYRKGKSCVYVSHNLAEAEMKDQVRTLENRGLPVLAFGQRGRAHLGEAKSCLKCHKTVALAEAGRPAAMEPERPRR